MYFSLNQTFSGSFEAQGGESSGSGAGNGGPGTMFFYHKGTQDTLVSLNRYLKVAYYLSYKIAFTFDLFCFVLKW